MIWFKITLTKHEKSKEVCAHMVLQLLVQWSAPNDPRVWEAYATSPCCCSMSFWLIELRELHDHLVWNRSGTCSFWKCYIASNIASWSAPSRMSLLLVPVPVLALEVVLALGVVLSTSGEMTSIMITLSQIVREPVVLKACICLYLLLKEHFPEGIGARLCYSS